jgi:hypothetical protein
MMNEGGNKTVMSLVGMLMNEVITPIVILQQHPPELTSLQGDRFLLWKGE